MKASFELEAVELEIDGGPVAGVDEAGRGPLAGPVVAAAVILDPKHIPDGIADSKVLDAEVRRALYQQILATAQVGVGVAGVDRIDAENILNASLWAMADAVDDLPCRPKLVLVDGNKVPPRLKCASRAIVRGDAKCLSIAAASIIAKVTRDTMMEELARELPGLRLRAPQGLRHGRAPRGDRAPRRHPAPPPLLQVDPAGAGPDRGRAGLSGTL